MTLALVLLTFLQGETASLLWSRGSCVAKMVFFTCNACGESVKKVQVEKHVAVCRNCECLSCIDCGEDFWYVPPPSCCLLEGEAWAVGWLPAGAEGAVLWAAWTAGLT